MLIRIHLYGKLHAYLEMKGDVSDVDTVYNYIASQYPDNDWEDVQCTSVDYGMYDAVLRVKIL